ncbi:MAG: DeoR/GlpR family DNA-binding transcription regulator [Candidatus Limnocylindrales bacterium]
MDATQVPREQGLSARERREAIAELVEDRGRFSVAELVGRFGVTDVSIRRDLMLLEDEGRIRRVHGGAVSASEGRGPGAYALKARRNRAQKGRIGTVAAGLIHPGDIVVFDSGSTVAQITAHVPALLRRSGAITVVTNSLPVIREISAWESPHLICLGGLYLPEHEALVGPQTVSELRDLSADIAFIGCDGLTPEMGLTTPHVLVAEVAAMMAARAGRVIAVADSSKLGRRGFTPIVPLNAIQVLITDQAASPEQLEGVRAAGVEVVLA